MMGYVVLSIIVCAVAFLAIPALNYTNVATFVSLEAAMCAFVLMAITQFLATRPPGVERLFGGLDKLYVAHRRIGYAVLALILVHYLYTPNFRGLFLNKELNDLAREIGGYAFYAVCALIVVSIVKWIPLIRKRLHLPYHVWYLTHRFIGLAFAAVAFHQLFVKKPFDQAEPIALVLNVFSVLGLGSYAYTQLLSHFRKRDYRVTNVERHPSATIVSVKPLGRPIRPRRGQFAILHARKSGLREPHPFTVASVADDGSLKFAIKPLGDFTARLRERIGVDDIIRLEGGYGRFDFRRGSRRQVWIAGGIGITPFLSMLSDVENNPSFDVILIYCVRDREEAIEVETFSSAAVRLPNFKFLLHPSAEAGRFDATKLAEVADLADGHRDIFFCGPNALRKAIVGGLSKMGLKPGKIWFERFEFR